MVRRKSILLTTKSEKEKERNSESKKFLIFSALFELFTFFSRDQARINRGRGRGGGGGGGIGRKREGRRGGGGGEECGRGRG